MQQMRKIAGAVRFSDADDITQTAALSAWLGCDKFRADCDFTGWILRIAHRTALTFCTSDQRYRTRVCTDSDGWEVRSMEDYHSCPSLILEAESRLALTCDRLQAMKPAARNMFLKYRLTPISYQDLVGQVPKYKSRLNRATARLLEIES
jgi:DNA-directed RNA polymerase specialized sigma24 family protein